MDEGKQMDAKLQQAIDASRAGDKIKAQKILVDLLQENPDEVQAWYLLSLLVDEKEQQAAYAAKALALDPAHEKAQERLMQLQQAAPAAAVTSAAPDFLAQAEGDSLPDWMAEDKELVGATAVTAAAPPKEEITAGELPDWIQEPVSEEWMKLDEPAPPPAKVTVTKAKPAGKVAARPSPSAAKSVQAKKKTPAKKLNRLDLILALLVIAVAIVVAYLFYLVTF